MLNDLTAVFPSSVAAQLNARPVALIAPRAGTPAHA
jgi:hypothetical protein